MAQVKVGDKIVVTNTEYPTSVPNGTVMTVSYDYEDGGVLASIDGGDGFEWCMCSGTYEPYTPPLKIYAGKYYMTRDGRKVGPMVYEAMGDKYHWRTPCFSGWWSDEGERQKEHMRGIANLISEWQDTASDDDAMINRVIVSVSSNEPKTYETLASLASKHGIVITVTVGDVVVQFDGRG